MVPLEYNQKHMEFFGFCPSEDGRSSFITLVKRATMLWLTIVMDLIPTSHFFYTHFDDNTAFLISSLTPIVAYIVVSTCYFTFFLEGKRAVHTFTYTRKLVNERTKSGMHSMYAEAERKSILVTKWPWRITSINYVLNSIFFAAQQIIGDWMNGNIDPTHWTITYTLSTPFNQHTSFGYFLVNLWKCITVFIYFVITTMVPAYFMSIFFYVEAICVDFENVILNLGSSSSNGYDAIKSELISAINLQTDADHLYKQLANVVSGPVFAQIVCDTIFISTTLFQLEMSAGKFDTEMAMTIFAAVVAILAILPFCYFTSRITLKIEQTADAAFGSCWYELPVNLQKNMMNIIAFAQLKRTVSGYGLLSCDLEGFMKIMKTSLTYYVMYRKFNN